MTYLFTDWNEEQAQRQIATTAKQNIRLRPYQLSAVDAVYEEWETVRATMLNMATGLGKSVCFAETMRRWDTETQGRILLIAHRRELILQAIGHAMRAGLSSGIEMAGKHAKGTEDVIVASVQTLNASRKCGVCFGEGCDECYGGKVKRFTRFNPRDFGLLVVDECFPSGTIVDGKPIESITKHDIVTAYNVVTKRTVKRRVVRVFKNPAPAKMVRITASGNSVVATANHPFLTQRGFVDAESITTNDILFGMWETHRAEAVGAKEEIRGRSAGLVLSGVLGRCEEGEYSKELRCLWNHLRASHPRHESESEEGNTSLLLTEMHESFSERTFLEHYGKDESKTRFSTDEGAKPCEARGCSEEDFRFAQAQWAQAENPGWEWSRANRTRKNAFGRNKTPSAHFPYASSTRQWIPNALQARPSGTIGKARCRDRRSQSRKSEGPGCRQEEGSLLDCARVDSVEVLECGRVGQPSKLCPDGYVYNFEVEGEHTYIANGFAVHNCHHAVSKSYRSVMKWFEQNPLQRNLMVTATPRRADKVGLHNVCESIAYTMELKEAINEGWLVPIRQKFVTVEGLDISKVDIRAGKLNEGQVEAAFLGTDEEEEKLLHAIVKPTIDEAAGRKTLVFAAGKDHANKLASCFAAHGVDAGVVVENTDPAERAELIARYSHGDLQVLVNCMVFTEGFDAPATEIIANCRPTKSEALYLQIIGRGTRPLAGVVDGPVTAEARKAAIEASDKKSCTILDFVGNSGDIKLVSVADVLAGDNIEPIDLAEALRVATETGETVDMEALAEKMKQSRLEAEERKEIERQQRLLTNTKADRADYSTVDVDLFGGPEFSSDAKYVEPISKGQQGFLYHQLGLTRKQTKHMSKRQASAIIGKTYKQAGDDWKRLIKEAGSAGELKKVGQAIESRKTSDYLMRDKNLVDSLRAAYVARKGELRNEQ